MSEIAIVRLGGRKLHTRVADGLLKKSRLNVSCMVLWQLCKRGLLAEAVFVDPCGCPFRSRGTQGVTLGRIRGGKVQTAVGHHVESATLEEN